jgi:NADH:ubiquinone oxidoreductase subunit
VRAHRRRRTDTAGKCRQNYWKQRRKQIGRSAPTKGTIPAASSSSLHQLVSNMRNQQENSKRRQGGKKDQRQANGMNRDWEEKGTRTKQLR